MTDTPILYVGEKNISTWSMRAWVAATWKGIPFEERTISLAADKDRKRRREVSPTGKLPVLHHRGIVIPDSLAIFEYFEEAFAPPAYRSLWPADTAERARSRWLSAAMHSGFMKIREGMSFNLCFLDPVPEASAAARQESVEVLDLWESHLVRGGPFLCGAFSGADVMYATMAVRLLAFKIPTDRHPLARAYMDALMREPAVASWLDGARKLQPVAAY
ncbi:MAG TPA: glutathione S-transferase N-terminal domain-containing protein [Candidatus Polarisedimenticolaceae bacterium]|nr:glutathione S-transferase N-terminal domain-containing protein [Candidatus Polarisedimenticolaceae bacterium]